MSHRWVGSSAALASLLAFLTAAVPASVLAQTSSVPAGSAQVQMGNVTFSLGASIGQVGGTAYERVYASGLRDFKVSELTWDFDNVAMVGAQGAASIGNRFQINLGYWSAVSEGDGSMVDRDWMLRDSGSDDEWTHESRHSDTTLDSGNMLDLNLGYRVFSRDSFSLSGILGYRRNEWEWSARGGDYVYSWDTNRDGYLDMEKEFRQDQGSFPDGELLIAYRQTYDVPYLGLGCEGAWGPVQLQGHLLYSPWVSGEDDDYHFRGARHYEGDFSGGNWFGAGASASWNFLPRWYATASVEYQKFDEIVGNVTETSPEGRFFYADGGGMELETVLLLLGVGFRF